jgi:hypothetical protein
MSRPIPTERRLRSLAPRGVVAASVLALGLALAAPAAAEEEYDAPDAGNPVRIAGYVLHPVGVIYDYLLLRPAWWIGSHQPFRTLFGRDD